MHYNKQGTLRAVPFLKLILILGVVVIHSNIKSNVTPGYSQVGLDIIAFIVSFTRVCVPSFFLISGYLFFYRVRKFTFEVYKEKLSRRVKTLLIPYLLWNLFCACLFLFKALVLNFKGLGIVDNGLVDWGKFFEGFLFIEQAQGFPFAFAFWFIRNLIAFVVLSPVVWLVARKWWSVVIFFAAKIVFGISTYGIEWFIIGAACSLNHISSEEVKTNKILTVAFGAIYLLLVIVTDYCKIGEAVNTLLFTAEVLAAFCFLYAISLRVTKNHDGKLLQLLCSATFFIYAFHQCFCTTNIKFWIHIFGCGSVLSCLASFLASFLTLVSVSLAAYLLLRKIAPGFLNVITGHRAQSH